MWGTVLWYPRDQTWCSLSNQHIANSAHSKTQYPLHTHNNQERSYPVQWIGTTSNSRPFTSWLRVQCGCLLVRLNNSPTVDIAVDSSLVNFRVLSSITCKCWYGYYYTHKLIMCSLLSLTMSFTLSLVGWAIFHTDHKSNLHTLHKQESYKELWKARFFILCPNYPHLNFNLLYCYYFMVALLFQKKAHAVHIECFCKQHNAWDKCSTGRTQRTGEAKEIKHWLHSW